MSESFDSSQPVGLIGLGAMGRGVASNLLSKGFQVVGRDINPEAMKWLQDQGGESATSLEHMAAKCKVVISYVVNDAQTESVLLGKDGIVPFLKPGSTIITCSTMPPAYARALSDRLAEKNIHYIDAPVSGGRVGAEKGTLTVMAAAPKGVFERMRPLLHAMGSKLFHLGEEPGKGSQMKVINQLLCGVHIAVAGEALAMAKQNGLPLDTTLEVLMSGAAGSWMLGDRGKRMVSGSFDDVASAVDIFVKDLGLVMDAARTSKFPAHLAHTAFLQFTQASSRGWGQQDDSAVMKNYTEK